MNTESNVIKKKSSDNPYRKQFDNFAINLVKKETEILSQPSTSGETQKNRLANSMFFLPPSYYSSSDSEQEAEQVKAKHSAYGN